MAWRIESQVIRGEVDNRTRGRVVGRVWLVGKIEPVLLELEGDACRDLAGRHLVFVNPSPRSGLGTSLAPRQIGVVGQFTASRKVKISDHPRAEFEPTYTIRPPSAHWGNSVYFEWFSLASGHVVIESAEYELTITPESAWEMSAAEALLRQRENEEAIKRFFDQLGFLSGSKPFPVSPDGPEPADELLAEFEGEENSEAEGEPLTEDEADEMIADSDRLTERLMERLDEGGEAADLEAILEEELERRRADAETEPLTPEAQAERDAWVEELKEAAEEISLDPEFIADLDRRHPLSERGRILSLRVMAEADRGHWVPAAVKGEHPVVDLVRSVTKAGGKLAGALDGRDWPPLLDECGLCIAWLKRARGFLTDAAVAGDFCRDQGWVPTEQLDAILREILSLQAEIEAVIDELRQRLARGFD